MEKLKNLKDISESTNLRINRNLYKDFILNKDMYLIAYENLKSKPGWMTPGINPETLDEIIFKLENNTFRFSPPMGRRILIPKKKKGRPLTIGSPKDKLVQEVMRIVLEILYEPLFKDTSHGFRPKRSCHTALREIFTKFKGCA